MNIIKRLLWFYVFLMMLIPPAIPIAMVYVMDYYFHIADGLTIAYFLIVGLPLTLAIIIAMAGRYENVILKIVE